MANKKQTPSLTPTSQIVKKKVSKGKSKKAIKPVLIDLKISGSLHNEKYDFNFNLSKDRVLSCGVDCKLSKRKSHLKRTVLKEPELKSLLNVIEKSKLFNAKLKPQKYLPCTLVGHLEIKIGDRTFKTTYAADPEQAKLHEKINPGLNNTIDAIYKIAAKKMKIKSAKP